MNNTTQSRILVSTAVSGWYLDPTDPGKKHRKKDGDVLMSPAEYKAHVDAEQAKIDAEDAPVRDQAFAEQEAAVTGKSPVLQSERDAKRKAADKKVIAKMNDSAQDEPRLVEIKDCWVPIDLRTPAQQKLFAGSKRDLSYEKIVKAAGKDQKAMPSGESRMVKPQDAFQVRFTVENQKLYAAEQRRNRARAKSQKAS